MMAAMKNGESYFKGRGAQVNPANPYVKNTYVTEHQEALDEPLVVAEATSFFEEYPKKIVNRVNSPDIPFPYSMNPYQGCEHGCTYCYARTTHQYWGMSAGLDFERKILIKENAPELLEKALENPRWKSQPIMLAGNTDCYQPIEKKRKITRRMLEVLLKYKHPVAIITKNSLILRDLDILSEMASMNLVRVAISVTTMEEDLRRKMEPRTASGPMRMRTIGELSKAGIPTTIMVAPIIPGLNSHEVTTMIRMAAYRGAYSAGYTLLRLNGPVADIFTDWIRKTYPDRADKVLRQVAEIHGGKLGDTRFGKRMRGEGAIADGINRLFKIAVNKYLDGRIAPPFDLNLFQRPPKNGQLSLFG